MNKTELIEAIAAEGNITKAAAENALNSLIDVVTETLSKGDSIQLVGFGSFSVGERAARTGRNPQTGVELKIPASKVVKFSVGSKLKEAVNAQPPAKKKK
ncbi:MAG: HU family DNA-binding protein [Zoogloeaceae bacterium]|jgi:DNA-binding protein HU-beta|nr:HU family DNA-binding protein [Zoogloeaceae bacterium]